MSEDFKIKSYRPNWNLYSWGIIILTLLLQLAKWRLLPMFIDIYYHLSVMLGFDRAGGYVTNAFWEYAPVGRPHLYPPLLHILMLLFYKIGFSKLFIARFFSFIMYPALLMTVWVFANKIFNKRFAFFSCLLTASSYYFYLEASNITAFSLALILGLFAILSIKDRLYISATILLALVFYTHSLMGWIILLSITLFGILNKNIISLFKIISISFVLYLPLFLYQLFNRKFFQISDLKAMHYIEIGIPIYLFAIIGAILCFIRKKDYYLLIAITLGFSLLIFNYKQRFFSGHGLIGFIFLAAAAIELFYLGFEKKFPKISWLFIFTCFIVFYLFYPTLNFNKELTINRTNSAFINIIPSIKPYQRANEINIYAPKFINPIADIINQNTDKDEIFYSNLSYAAGMLSVFSDRATSCAMLPEVKPYKNFDLIKVSSLVVWFKELDGSFSLGLKRAIQAYGLKQIAQTQLVYIYKNPFANTKLSIPRPLLSTGIIFSILFICIVLVLYDIYRFKEKS